MKGIKIKKIDIIPKNCPISKKNCSGCQFLAEVNSFHKAFGGEIEIIAICKYCPNN